MAANDADGLSSHLSVDGEIVNGYGDRVQAVAIIRSAQVEDLSPSTELADPSERLERRRKRVLVRVSDEEERFVRIPPVEDLSLCSSGQDKRKVRPVRFVEASADALEGREVRINETLD